MIEFDVDGVPWVVNGAESLLEDFDLEEGDLPRWVAGFVESEVVWELLREYYSVGPMLDFAGLGWGDVRACAKSTGMTQADVERELLQVQGAWKKEQAMRRKREERRAELLGEVAGNVEEMPVMGAAEEVDPVYAKKLVEANGFGELPESEWQWVAARIIELGPQLNAPATRVQAQNLIQLEVQLKGGKAILQILGRRQQEILSDESLTTDTQVKRLEGLQKQQLNAEKNQADLARKHETMMDAIGADEVTLAVQKKACLDQIGYSVEALLDWYGKQDNYLIDGIFTAREVVWQLTETPYKPRFYRPHLSVRLREALEPSALWDPEWVPSKITREAQRHLAQIVKAYGEVVEAEEMPHVPGVDDIPRGQDGAEDEDEDDPGDLAAEGAAGGGGEDPVTPVPSAPRVMPGSWGGGDEVLM